MSSRSSGPTRSWASDITYIAMRQGFLYLVAILDWATRKVLAWRLSNTLTSDFCVAALNEALVRHGAPGIFNTDQGSKFTSQDFTDVLKIRESPVVQSAECSCGRGSARDVG